MTPAERLAGQLRMLADGYADEAKPLANAAREAATVIENQDAAIRRLEDSIAKTRETR